MKKNPKVAVIVLNWNGKEDTSACLASLEKISYPNAEVIIVDNGSSDDSVSHFKEAFPKITVLETGDNLGYAGGNNVGIEYGLKNGIEFFLILNNDTVVDPQIVEAFLSTYEEHVEAGILGAKTYRMDEPNLLSHFGGIWKPKWIHFDFLAHDISDDGESFELAQRVDYTSGSCIMVHRLVFEAIGLMDPRFFLYWEETDFCFRAKKAGFAVMTCPKAKAWHKISSSMPEEKSFSTYFFWRNRLLWIERNFTGFERIFYFAKILLINALGAYKLRALRYFQVFLIKYLKLKKDPTKSLFQIKRYSAALCGTKDYLLRRFDKGSSELFK